MDFEKYTEVVKNNSNATAAQAVAAVSPIVDGNQLNRGIHEVEKVGTGFYILQCSVLQDMVDDGIVGTKTTKSPQGSKNSYGFYELVYKEDNLNRLSEDYSFCWRIKQLGHSVYAYKGPGVTHTGEFVFSTT